MYRWMFGGAGSVILAISMLAGSPALGAGDANRTRCSASSEASPGFRSYLPDCRAYEMVTPPYKEGGTVSTSEPQIAPDGLSLASGSFAAFAGTPNDAFANTEYLFQRQTWRWETRPLSLPAAVFPLAYGFVADADLGAILWNAATSLSVGAEQSLYLASGPGASLARVGPERPPPDTEFGGEVVGGSGALSHVVFRVAIPTQGEVELNLNHPWPGDTTVNNQPSLYEYFGTGNREPVLVGVSNQGPLHGVTHINEGAELISQCGTTLGGLGTPGPDAYNSISADGGTVFFTAHSGPCERQSGAVGIGPKVDEIYARIGAATTVALSEPAVTSQRERECSGVCREDENEENGHERKPAEFAGASADGTKVFFTTDQPLVTADENGEAAGRDLYEVELHNGAITNLIQVSHDPESSTAAAEVQGVARVSEDGSHVYFVARGVLTGANAAGRSPEAGADNLYVYDTEHVTSKFLATLSASDAADWSPEDGRPVQTTPDGAFLVFPSVADLTPDDTSSAAQLFEYDAQAETLRRVSVGHNGYNDNGNITAAADAPNIPQPKYGRTDTPAEASSGLALSEDGSTVVFESSDALAPQAAPGANNVYEYRGRNVYLVSDGHDTLTSRDGPAVKLLGVDPSGKDVFFSTADPLVPQDADTQVDIYDAREEGGFPAPVASAGCEGDTCQAPPGAAPVFAAPPSTALIGSGNIAAPISKAKPKPLTNAQKLAKALKACKSKPKKQRHGCEAQATKRYGRNFKLKPKSHKGGK